MFVSRYNWVIAGQIFPVWGKKYAIYSPNYLEWFVVLSCIGACLLFYSLGVKFLPLKEEIREK
jgi:Ni/Fe-hydrogenase subunit HybB-like protein